jgi:outer membrane receptor protein involved in Fe transport
MLSRGCQTVLVGAVGSTIASAASAALAQTNDSCPTGCPEAPIIVTGSRIPAVKSASAPLQRIDAENIDRSGVINLQDLLNENPEFGNPLFNRTNSNFSTDSAGMATVNLRNLGESRTLVLVNGRRLVPTVPGTGVVDLNVIPTQLVARVDVLTGGASSIYGSDAVAGVVNIILDDKFEGTKAEGQSGLTGKGDDVRTQASLTYGIPFARGRGHLVLYGGYSNEGAVFSRTRERTATQALSCFQVNGSDPFAKCGARLSIFTPPGSVSAGSFDDPVGFTFFGGEAIESEPKGFNFNLDRLVAVPTKRYLLNALGRFDVSDRLSATLEASFARTEAWPQLEPVPLDSASIFPETGGRFDIESLVAGRGGTLNRVRNPFVQDAIFNAAVDTDGNGLRDVGFLRRMSEFGDRGSDAVRRTWRVLAGLEGSFGSWRWNAYYSYGRSSQDQVTHGLFDFSKLRQALLVVPDISDVNHNGNVTEPICLDAQARAEGCVPANLFGGAGALADTYSYLHVDGISFSEVTQHLAGAGINGSLLELPGGELGVAAGVEYRREHSRQEYDQLTQAGLNGSNALPNLVGGFSVSEAYGELVAPILASRPFVDMLRLRGALRVAHYTTVGTDWTWNYGLEYAPVEPVRFRAVKSRAVRAPNIGELFIPQTEADTFVSDPCDGVTAATPGILGDTCRSAPGVSENIAQNGKFTVSQIDFNTVSATFGGNRELREEKADSLTAGMVLNPIRGLTVTTDYFRIKVSDAIFGLSEQLILNECYAEGIALLCNLVTRRPAAVNGASSGSLDRIDTRLINSGGLEIKGIDSTISYRGDLAGGHFDFSLAYTHLMRGLVVAVEGGPKDRFAGEVGSSRDRATASISYDRAKWGATLRAIYVGPAYLNDQLPGVERTSKFKTHAETVFDAQVRFTRAERFQFYLGVDNLLDNAPPLIMGGAPGTNTDAGTYDAIGRRFYAGARARF